MKPNALLVLFTFVAAGCGPSASVSDDASGGDMEAFTSDDVLPYQSEHVHGSTIVELPDGGLMVAWFQGSGERWADDVRIMGARKPAGSQTWSDAFVMADVPGFPDINPVLWVDGQDRLWLFWYTVLANQWETSLLKYRVSDDYLGTTGAPAWTWQEDIHARFATTERGILPDDPFVLEVTRQVDEQRALLADTRDAESLDRWKERILARATGQELVAAGRVPRDDGSYDEQPLGYPIFRRIGWQTRNKPVTTRTGRIILPLYSDGFSFTAMTYSDDDGATWHFSAPLVGAGNIQAAIAQTAAGELVAYMRDNGPAPKRLHISRSSDDGATWSTVLDSDRPNPGSGADIVTLRNGHWVLISNDVESGRNRLSVVLSEDEGASWPWQRVIELDESSPPRTAHYPAIIEGRDGRLHASYSYFVPASADSAERKTIRHASFTEGWIRGEE